MKYFLGKYEKGENSLSFFRGLNINNCINMIYFHVAIPMNFTKEKKGWRIEIACMLDEVHMTSAAGRQRGVRIRTYFGFKHNS